MDTHSLGESEGTIGVWWSPVRFAETHNCLHRALERCCVRGPGSGLTVFTTGGASHDQGLKGPRYLIFPRSRLRVQGLLDHGYSRGLGTSCWTLGGGGGYVSFGGGSGFASGAHRSLEPSPPPAVLPCPAQARPASVLGAETFSPATQQPHPWRLVFAAPGDCESRSREVWARAPFFHGLQVMHSDPFWIRLCFSLRTFS